MAVVAVTFLVALAAVFGKFWLLVLRPEDRERREAIARIRGERIEKAAGSIVLEPTRLSSIPALDQLLVGRGLLTGHVQHLLVESGLSWNVGAFLLICAVCALAAFMVAWNAFGVFVLGIPFGAVGLLLPYFYVRYKRSIRLRVFEEQFPEAIDLISRALRAGHALTTALGMVADEIPAPVGPEFRRLYDEQNFGMSLPDALRAMARRVPVLDARFFVTAVLTQRESGGNLSEVLDNLASVMRERFKFRRQIRVVSAHGRISALVLSALPPVLAAVLFALSPDFMRVLWEDPLGVRLVMVAAGLQFIGMFTIARMVRVEY